MDRHNRMTHVQEEEINEAKQWINQKSSKNVPMKESFNKFSLNCNFTYHSSPTTLFLNLLPPLLFLISLWLSRKIGMFGTYLSFTS